MNSNLAIRCCLLNGAALSKEQESESKVIVTAVGSLLCREWYTDDKCRMLCLTSTVQGEYGVYHVSVSEACEGPWEGRVGWVNEHPTPLVEQLKSNQSTDVPHPGLERKDLV